MRAPCCALLLLAWFCTPIGLASEAADEQGAPLPVVGRYGDLSALEIEGNDSFASDEIRQALARDLKVQESCRPSAPLAEFIDTLEERLAEGYRYSGCPDAKVTVSISADERLVARVEEGQRYREGEIEVQGVTEPLKDAIVTSLTCAVDKAWHSPEITLIEGGQRIGPVAPTQGKTPKENEKYSNTFWEGDRPLRFGETAVDKMHARVTETILRQGYPRASFRLSLKRNEIEKLANLVVQVDDLGRQTIFEEIVVNGLTRHSRQQLLELMQLTEGETFDVARLHSALEKVHQSCRFWKCHLTVDLPGDRVEETEQGGNPPGARLTIDIIEYPHVARLGEPLSEVDEILRRAAGWCQQFDTQEEWEVYGRFDTPEGAPYQGSYIEFWLLPRDGIMLDYCLKGSHPDSERVLNGKYRVVASNNRLSIADLVHRDSLTTRFQATGLPNFQLATAEVEEGDYKTRVTLGFGMSNAKQPQKQILVSHPVALVDLAHNDDARCEVREGVLAITEAETFAASFDAATGRLIEYSLYDRENSERWPIVLSIRPVDTEGWREREAEIATLPNRWKKARPLASLAIYATDIAGRVSSTPDLVTKEKREAIQEMVNRPTFVALDQYVANYLFDASPAIPESAFQLPDSWVAHQNPKYSLAGLPDGLFVRETWPWTVSREATYMFAGKLKLDREARATRQDQELSRLLARSDTGPICHWVLGKVGKTGRYTARQALEQLDDGTLDREIEMLTAPETGVLELLGYLVPVANAASDEEIERLAGSLESPFSKWVGQAAQLLRRLDGTNQETLRQSLDSALKNDFRQRLEFDLQRLATGTAPRYSPSLDFDQLPKSYSFAPPEEEKAKSEGPKKFRGGLAIGEEGAAEKKE